MCSVGNTAVFFGLGWVKSVSRQEAVPVLAALQPEGDPAGRRGVKEETDCMAGGDEVWEGGREGFQRGEELAESTWKVPALPAGRWQAQRMTCLGMT